MGDNNGAMGPADVAALMKNNNNWGDGNYFIWLLFFFMIYGFGGFGGWGNNNARSAMDTSAAAQGGYLTGNAFNDALRLQTIQTGQHDIINAVNSSKYDIVNANAATEARLIENQANIIANQQANAQAQQACCADIKYNAAMNTASINEKSTENTQKILDAISANRMADMQNQINSLQSQLTQSQNQANLDRQLDQRLNPMQQQLFMTTKYPNPNAFSYTAGANPFCNCNCNCGTTV